MHDLPMLLLSINSGSSSLKFDLYVGNTESDVTKVITGKIDRFGLDADVSLRHMLSGQTRTYTTRVLDHETALRISLREIVWFIPDATPAGIDRIGFRIVHGGEFFTAPVIINDIVLRSLEHLGHPAPLHNPPALATIRAAKTIFPDHTKCIGVFDTEFHTALPDIAKTYALPYKLNEKYDIRRYGFHGMAHQYMTERYAYHAGKQPRDVSVITLQLGSGCSVCAVKNGQSVDTSMGFTPLEGLMMRTRTGDIDAGLVSYLAREERMDGHRMEELLNKESGLAGLSGTDGDMRTLIARYGTDHRCKLAVDLFCYRTAKTIMSYIPATGMPEALIFGGGIGELSPFVRRHICEYLGAFGVRLSETCNAEAVGVEKKISEPESILAVWTVLVDESSVIAKKTISLQ
jgi:acetate kinase